jgi:hypothetical protein
MRILLTWQLNHFYRKAGVAAEASSTRSPEVCHTIAVIANRKSAEKYFFKFPALNIPIW